MSKIMFGKTPLFCANRVNSPLINQRARISVDKLLQPQRVLAQYFNRLFLYTGRIKA